MPDVTLCRPGEAGTRFAEFQVRNIRHGLYRAQRRKLDWPWQEEGWQSGIVGPRAIGSPAPAAPSPAAPSRDIMSAHSDHVRHYRIGLAAVIEINRPPVNAINHDIRAGLIAALTAIADDAGVERIILAG
ncbi:MAG: hypothetical protein VW495_01870, partial [Rhodobiaceae bacterium]